MAFTNIGPTMTASDTVVTTDDSAGIAAGRRLMNVYMATGLVLVFILMLVGLIMRLNQAQWIQLEPSWFYSLMTLHGAGMIVALVLCGMGSIWYLVRRETTMDIGLSYWTYGIIVAGVVAVLLATVIGKFAAAWTTLYPLPFINPTWAYWSTGAFFTGLILVSTGWTIWSLQILEAVMRAFGGLRGALGIDLVFRPKVFKESGRKAPPAQILPATVIAIDGLVMTTAGMLLCAAMLVRWLDPGVGIDPLWAKNLGFFFGHLLANYVIYMLLALVYVGLPRFTNRTWKTNAVFVMGWWGTLVFLLAAYAHHLYLDFAQPEALQVMGHVASYLSSIPVSVVTVYGAILLVWRSGIRWSLGSLFMYTGLIGWILGGAGALLDATVQFNIVLHNTLWVPAHFHSYLLGGSLYFALGWVFQTLEEKTERRTPKAMLWTICTTVFGGTLIFLASFYIAGAASVPRRFAVAQDPSTALAALGSIGAILLIAGLIICFMEGMRLWLSRQPQGAPIKPTIAPQTDVATYQGD